MEKSLKATAKSPANIAFIKYWGKADPKTRLPQNNSISMCLSNLYSICTVEFSKTYNKDDINFLDEEFVEEKELGRIIEVLDRLRNLKGAKLKAKVVTMNNFPKATGIASSASGFSSVTLAALSAIGLKLNKIELSKLSRLASGTASRSIPDGFVEWKKGTNESNSYAVQVFPPDYWQISDVVAIVTYRMKKIKSTEGHALADASPFQKSRIGEMEAKIKAIKKAMREKDFTAFGQIVEAEALNMHAVCMTSKPPILYWEGSTMEMMRLIQDWRERGEVESYFTIDAGPTVHAICELKDEKRLAYRLAKIKGVQKVIINRPSVGARLINKHLF